jgi:hypothetical protein
MFAVDEATAEAIRRLLDESGELAAAVEVRRLFPGIPDLAKARDCARIIGGWKPLPPPTATSDQTTAVTLGRSGRPRRI